MLVAAAVDMIDSHKFWRGFSATNTCPAVDVDHFIANIHSLFISTAIFSRLVSRIGSYVIALIISKALPTPTALSYQWKIG